MARRIDTNDTVGQTGKCLKNKRFKNNSIGKCKDIHRTVTNIHLKKKIKHLRMGCTE
jgi:hypothetical protein